MARNRRGLRRLEDEAADWLAAHPTPAGTAAFYDAFKSLPYLNDHVTQHSAYVSQSEQTLETTLCFGCDRGRLPLPLPKSRAQCACAELRVSVEKIYLSGSGRERSDVRLFPDEASDIDVMLQLGPVRVEHEDQSQLDVVETREDSSNLLGDSVRKKNEVSELDAADPLMEHTMEVDTEGCRISEEREEGAREEIEEKNSEVDGETSTEASLSSPDIFYSCEDIPMFLEGACAGPSPSPSSCALKPQSSSSPSSSRPCRPVAITVTATPAVHCGFFLLHHRRLPSCRHRDRLPLPASRAVALMDCVRAGFTSRPPTVSGPAVSIIIDSPLFEDKAIDLVPCVPFPQWPSRDFASRPRASGQPSLALVARLCRTQAFLVPVGFSGSETEELEWRLSFSRHEYVAYRSMTKEQRLCLTTLKYCRAVTGEAAKPLKSYYLKTALMWLVESRAADQWTLETMHESLLLILRYLDVCLRRGCLPCYFWPEINVFANRSDAELAEVSAAVAELRRRLLPTILALLADWLGQSVPALAQYLLIDGRVLSRDQWWNMTGALWLRELGAGRKHWKRPLYAIRDLVFNGKIPLTDDTKLPLCSSLMMSVAATKEYRRAIKRDVSGRSTGITREIRKVVGFAQPILKLFKQIRTSREAEDSWMVED